MDTHSNPRGEISWGLLGCGDLADKRVCAALQQSVQSRLSAVWGRDPEKVSRFAAKHQIPHASTSLSDMLKMDLDAIYICTPPDTHLELTLQAIEARKHVLIEKPMAMSPRECVQIISAAAQQKVTVGVAYYRRAYPKMIYVRNLIEQGILGTPTWVNIVLHTWYAPPTSSSFWRTQKQRSGGAGALADGGVHRLDLLDYWLGPVRVLYSNFQHLVQTYEVEDASSMVLELSNGAPVHAHFSWNSKTWMDRFELVGSEAKIILDPLDSPSLEIIRGRDRETLKIDPPTNAHLPCIEDFVAALNQKEEPLCDGKAGLRINQILESVILAQSSIKEAGPMIFTPAPVNDFPEFIETYYQRCRQRVPEIEACAGKWTLEDLIPGLSDFDTRFLVKDRTEAKDWCQMSMEVAQVHYELAKERKEWARNLEHLPGVNLKWNEFLDSRLYYPEFSQWTFHHGEPALLEKARVYLNHHVWDASDEIYHWKRIATFFGRYNRTIDPAINLGPYLNKYPLHSRLMHYFAPPVHSAVCLMLKETHPGKIEAFRKARELFPDSKFMDRILQMIENHYEHPCLMCEPGMSQFDDELETYLQKMIHTLLSRKDSICASIPPHPTVVQLKTAVDSMSKQDSFFGLFEHLKFARLMKGRLWFYGQNILWFDSQLLIRNELGRIYTNFFVTPLKIASQLIYKKTMEPDRVLEILAKDLFNSDELEACRQFEKVASAPCSSAELKQRALEIAGGFDLFLHAMEKLMAKIRRTTTSQANASFQLYSIPHPGEVRGGFPWILSQS